MADSDDESGSGSGSGDDDEEEEGKDWDVRFAPPASISKGSHISFSTIAEACSVPWPPAMLAGA